tara:strand:- start:405 stop:569 length:165 start_codon:yes stop_codon:yes gene_type:complete
LNTTEDVFANRLAVAGAISVGIGLYYAIDALAVVGSVVLGLWGIRKYLMWKDEL